MHDIDQIKSLLDKGMPDEAIGLINDLLSVQKDDQLYYLRGNAHRMKSEWHLAMNDYLEAKALNPTGPASEAYDMIEDILNFYNKDLFNH